MPYGRRVYCKSAMLRDVDECVLDALIGHTESIPSPFSAVVLELYGGAVNRVPKDATAYPHRDAVYSVNAISMWPDATHDEPNIQWARDVWDAMRPFSTNGVYVNFLGVGDASADRVKAAYGANYDRLTRIKAAYDPTNFFRLNHNIQPRGEVAPSSA
jgi:hypothetical protein